MTHDSVRRAPRGDITVTTNLPAGHPAKSGLDAAIHAAIGSLPGEWDVTVEANSETWTVTVVGPDGSRWSMICADSNSVLNHDVVAEQVGAACRRRLARSRRSRSTTPKGDGPSVAAPAVASPAVGRPPAKSSH